MAVGTHHPVPNPNPTGEFRTRVMNTIYINNMYVCVCECTHRVLFTTLLLLWLKPLLS